jgi:TPR repeat protein
VEALGLLGLIHRMGLDGPRDFEKAKAFLTDGARKGDTLAQAELGLMYSEGEGLPKDLVAAYMWLNLAAAKSFSMGKWEASVSRDILEDQMTKEQIAEAQKLSREWKPETNKQ